jgi:hypothetical protein
MASLPKENLTVDILLTILVLIVALPMILTLTPYLLISLLIYYLYTTLPIQGVIVIIVLWFLTCGR